MQTDNKRPSRFNNKRLAEQFSHSLKLCTVLAFTVSILSPLSAFGLTLAQAETMALENDPLVASQQATARAQLDESIASNALPDPKLRLGLFNVPIDSFSTSKEPTTQWRFGLQQAFPRGDTLDLKQQQSALMSQSSSAMADDSKLKIVRDLRETYFNLYYEIEAGKIIKDTSSLFRKLVEITEAQYAAGRVNQQDVIRADLELSRLEDRETSIQSKQDVLRAQLALWVGDSAWKEIEPQLPALPELPEKYDVNLLLTEHPSVKTASAKVAASQKMTDMARQDYKPGYNAFIEYRKRDGTNANGSDRTDMMAAMVTMDIPLFTENRQDKKVSANEEKSLAAKYQRDDKLRQLKRSLDKDMAIYKRLGERENIYKQELLKSAKNNSAASLNAYQSGITEFTTLMRAGITELEVRLADLRIRVDRKRAQARLLYITGEKK